MTADALRCCFPVAVHNVPGAATAAAVRYTGHRIAVHFPLLEWVALE